MQLGPNLRQEDESDGMVNLFDKRASALKSESGLDFENASNRSESKPGTGRSGRQKMEVMESIADKKLKEMARPQHHRPTSSISSYNRAASLKYLKEKQK